MTSALSATLPIPEGKSARPTLATHTSPPNAPPPPFPEDARSNSRPFDIYASYQRALSDPEISAPLAAILSLTELVSKSEAGTMFELVKALNDGAEALRTQIPNPIGLNAGSELFIAFVTLFPHAAASFPELKKELIAELSLGFIKDDSVILTHSYSRVVMQTLLLAHKRKRISVYVTEARPRGLGIKTYEELTAAGIPCIVVLDSAVAYVMDKVDFVLVGSEAVVESGGLVNAVGSNQMAVIAKAENKPFYALAESYKFHRLFPLSQYDLPTHSAEILSFAQPVLDAGSTASRPLAESASHGGPVTPSIKPAPATVGSKAAAAGTVQRTMSLEQIAKNPGVDYTRPDLISLVFSDVGVLTPEGVSQYLVGMFAG
ncbi:unnamed protein product [Peniophora sp. CBMAI 1063]|nr:unnamed protein product [Peniophora sp. CBMAI 1063]